jgi:putative ABC transporter, permease permease
MNLFLLEIKRILKSLSFWIFFVIMCVFMATQLSDSYIIDRPTRDDVTYKTEDDLNYIYPTLLKELVKETELNSFDTYPRGFYRNVSLDDNEINLMKKLIEDLCGTNYEDASTLGIHNIPNRENLENNLKKIDSLLGGGSSYSINRYKNMFGQVPTSYEERIDEYKLMKANGLDKSFARYFCDYAGITIFILIYFIPLGVFLKDSNKSISSSIFTKSSSTRKILFTRLWAMAIVTISSILLIFTCYELILVNLYGIELLNPVTAYGLIILWLFPNIVLGISLGSLITILINNILAGVFCFLISFMYIITSSPNISGAYGFSPIIRHNIVGMERYFLDNFNILLENRIMWFIISLLIALIASIALDKKRVGRL